MRRRRPASSVPPLSGPDSDSESDPAPPTLEGSAPVSMQALRSASMSASKASSRSLPEEEEDAIGKEAARRRSKGGEFKLGFKRTSARGRSSDGTADERKARRRFTREERRLKRIPRETSTGNRALLIRRI